MRRVQVLTLVLLVALVSAAVPAGATTQDQVTLTVSVVDQDGDPVGGATIQATWEDGESSAQTASNGKAFVDVPEGADVELQVEDDTYVRNAPYEVEDASDQQVTVRVAEKSTVTVRVTDQNGAVPNATVSIERDGRTVDEGPTNDNGAFTSRIVERGEYSLELSKEGYYENETRLVLERETVLREVAMRRGNVQVEFRVSDDHFDPARPIDGATVAVGDVGTARTTGGTAVFALPVNTDTRVEVTKEGYQTVERALYVRESSRTVRLTTQREEVVTVASTNSQVVVGETTTVSVTNAYDEPLRGAEVLLDGEAVGETDSAGELRISIESEGEHTLRARAGDVRSEATTVTGISPGAETPTDTPTASPTATATGTATATEPPTTTTAVSLPGFTPVVAVLGLLLAGLLFRRR